MRAEGRSMQQKTRSTSRIETTALGLSSRFVNREGPRGERAAPAGASLVKPMPACINAMPQILMMLPIYFLR